MKLSTTRLALLLIIASSALVSVCNSVRIADEDTCPSAEAPDTVNSVKIPSKWMYVAKQVLQSGLHTVPLHGPRAIFYVLLNLTSLLPKFNVQDSKYVPALFDTTNKLVNEIDLQTSTWHRIDAGRETALDLVVAQIDLSRIMFRMLFHRVNQWNVQETKSQFEDLVHDARLSWQHWKGSLELLKPNDMKTNTPKLTRSLQIKSISRSISMRAGPLARSLSNAVIDAQLDTAKQVYRSRLGQRIWRGLAPSGAHMLDIVTNVLVVIWILYMAQASIMTAFSDLSSFITFQLAREGITIRKFIMDLMGLFYIIIQIVLFISKYARRFF